MRSLVRASRLFTTAASKLLQAIIFSDEGVIVDKTF